MASEGNYPGKHQKQRLDCAPNPLIGGRIQFAASVSKRMMGFFFACNDLFLAIHAIAYLLSPFAVQAGHQD
jgi:hypothetical protein